MSCRAAAGLPRVAPRLGTEHDAILLDLARRGDEATFKDLARCLGADLCQADALWRRACAGIPVPPAGSTRAP